MTDTAKSTKGLPRREWCIAVLIVIGATLIAYHNTFRGEFIFDDRTAIVENPTIRQLWRISQVFSPPPGDLTVSGRPLLNFSLAINHAIGGTDVRSYHVLNFIVHAFAALVLFGIVRRTLLQPCLSPSFGSAALVLATATAVLWAVHPIQTESVTYVVQRAESLMGLFYLLVIYCLVRGTESASGMWFAFGVLFCLCGMATKEVMATAPLMALLYDRTFLAGTFLEALRRQWRVYLGLFSTWLLLAYLVATGGAISGGTAGFNSDVGWQNYALTQLWAVTHYLRLAIWPFPLVLDYGGAVLIEPVSRVLPAAVILVALVGATLFGLHRWPAAGFLGGWFFGILSITSSIFPLRDTIFEHRAYLSLAAIIVLFVCLTHRLIRRWSVIVFVSAAVACIFVTIDRNEDYQNELTIWADTVEKRPKNLRAHYNLANALSHADRADEAIKHYRVALSLDSSRSEVHFNLANTLGKQGRYEEAIQHYATALKTAPDDHAAHANLAAVLTSLNRFDEAIPHYQEALRLRPGDAAVFNNFGYVLMVQGKPDEAIVYYRKALQIKPDFASAWYNLGNAFVQKKSHEEAIAAYRETLRINARHGGAHLRLANLLEQKGAHEQALTHFEAALRVDANNPVTHFGLARMLVRLNRRDEAIEHLREAVRLRPGYVEAQELLKVLGE